MTGQLIVTVAGATVVAGASPPRACCGPMPNPTTRAVFRLDQATCLYYNDARRFGWIRLAGPARAQPTRSFAGSGPSRWARRSRLPCSGRASPGTPGPRSRPCCSTRLSSQESATSTPTSACITPASTPPARPVRRPDPGRDPSPARGRPRQSSAARHKTGGTSFAAYVNDFRGQRGHYLDHAEVFRRQGQPCDMCGTLITRTKVAGRATNFCPHCQQRWDNNEA